VAPQLKSYLSMPQTAAFKAATANALTTVFAGFAFTICILPKISLLPALVAGFTRVLMRQRPGITKIPFFLTSAVPAKVYASTADVSAKVCQGLEAIAA